MATPNTQPPSQDSPNAPEPSQSHPQPPPSPPPPSEPQDQPDLHHPPSKDLSPSPSLSSIPLTSYALPPSALSTPLSPTRDLPSKDSLSAHTFEDAYVQFILYCNPALSGSLSTTELRRGFNAVPRADGKSFEVWGLFKLVERLEKGEVGTWNALVVELGVERPDTGKGQSTQKLGQYAVRLKRWLHAYHIDAFFQYCLNRPNDYYTSIPTNKDRAIPGPRDGVEPEDDLALRALIPNFRPKRGRRKEDEDKDLTPIKRLRVKMTASNQSHVHPSLAQDSSEPSPQPPSETDQHPSYPHSALPSYNHDAYMAEAFASASRAFKVPGASSPPSTSPFPFNPGPPPYISPWNGYPHSAIESHAPPNLLSSERDGSQSAHPGLSRETPEKVGSKKRPGSNVSAAWTSNTSRIAAGKTGRGKGRPPQNRAVNNGPYATFPSYLKDLPKIRLAVGAKEAAVTSLAVTPEAEHTQATESPIGFRSDSNAPNSPPAQQQQKPSKLSLQVPRHPSGNVRLVTPPPPKVIVNDGENGRQKNQLAPSQVHRMTGREEDRTPTDPFSRIGENIGEVWDGDEEGIAVGNLDEELEGGGIDWKRRALYLERKLRGAQAELKAVKRRVMEAVM